MKLVLTGSSSFTGFWIAYYAIKHGIEVHATCTKSFSDYQGLNKYRIDFLKKNGCYLYEKITFGSLAFKNLLTGLPNSVLSIHGTHTANYKEDDKFDLDKAIAENLSNISAVFAIAKRANIKLVYTGSAFQGVSEFSSVGKYGLSKYITWATLKTLGNYWGVPTTCFVISNPFGALQDGRLSSYILKCANENILPRLQDPWSIQDNILVEGMTRKYIEVIKAIFIGHNIDVVCPTQFVESNINFASRILNKSGQYSLARELILANTEENLLPKKSSLIVWGDTKDKVLISECESDWNNFLLDKLENLDNV